MRYPRIYAAVFDSPWAIQLTKLEAIIELIEFKAAGGMYSADEIRVRTQFSPEERDRLRAEWEQAQLGSDPGRIRILSENDARTSESGAPVRRVGTIAVLPIAGVIAHRISSVNQLSGPGGTSTEGLGQQFDAVIADPDVVAVVFDVDSPGGSVFGVQELADKIHAARGTKPIVAVSNALAASAGYWLASAADEVVVTPSGEVGSIGVYGLHQDVSRAADAAGYTHTFISAGRYKVEGNSFEPLGDEARAAMQGRVDDYYRAFTSAVARGRGVSAVDVRNGFGEGRVVGAQQAVKLGMADRVATLDETIARLANPRSRAHVGQRAEHDPTDDFYYEPLPPKGSAADLDYRRRRARLHAV